MDNPSIAASRRSAVGSFREVHYSPQAVGLPAESFSLSSLLQRVEADSLATPERLDFNLVIIPTAGSGTHMVDFAKVEMRQGMLLHIRPTQVHQWAPDGYEATLLVFPDIPEVRPTSFPSGPRTYALKSSEWEKAGVWLEQLQDETRRTPLSPRSRRIATAFRTLVVTTLRLDIEDGAVLVSRSARPYLELRQQLESEPDWSRSVSERAGRLGYSARTLSRACIAFAGLTAKQVVDQRVILEARRLLSVGTPPTQVAALLDFDEATNFTKFYKRVTGVTPSSWLIRESQSTSDPIHT